MAIDSESIRNLKLREPKAWKMMDQCLSEKKGIPWPVKQRAAEWVLNKIYPEKRIIEGNFTSKHEHYFKLSKDELESEETTILNRIATKLEPSAN